MATESDETYFRKYLDDPTSITPGPTPQQVDNLSTDPNESYFRKYLVDPLVTP